MTTQELIQQEAERLYEMCDNPNNDIGIREFNQRNYDRKQSFIEGATFGYSLAEKKIERLERAIRKMDADFIIAEK